MNGKMKYRIVEFKISNEKGDKFFIETGEIYFTYFFFFHKINWTVESGHDTFSKALSRVKELKKAQPIYHEVK